VTTTTNRRADELIPGDRFDTRCGIGLAPFRTITRVRIEENDRPGSQDRVEITFDTDAMCNIRMFLANSIVRVLVKDQIPAGW
jgi:hypothetical protein